MAAQPDNDVTVRDGAPADMPQVLQMIHELVEYEAAGDQVIVDVEALIRDGFSADGGAWFFSLVAEDKDGELVGHLLCNRAYSSSGGRSYYVEDLYVRPGARRRGVGALLLQRLCARALAEGVRRVDWHVLRRNASALRFYARLGARDLALDGRAALRLPRERIEAVAAGRLLPPPAALSDADCACAPPAP